MTGSTGFVGKCLVKMLEELGYRIFHLVRNRKGFEHEFVWDFKNRLSEELPSCDVVIHLAAHVDFNSNLGISQYDVNTVSTIKLSAYAKSQSAYFILASTIGAHGSQHSLIDKDTPINPENHYAMSKYLAEEIVKTYIDNYSILRICGIYGLDGPIHLGLNKAINDAVHKKIPPVSKGSGKAKRNYICVLDVARWILNLVQQYEEELKRRKGNTREILYVASPEVMTIEDYLQIIVDTILPNENLTKIEGSETRDLVVKASQTHFALTTFRQYMSSLKL